LTRRISVPFFPAITNGMKKVFKKHKIDLVTTSSGYKLKNQLHSTKDMKPTNEKSGVYEIKCGTRNCHYLG
jgi:DNA-binding LacI/PurR family transcriptional regulator